MRWQGWGSDRIDCSAEHKAETAAIAELQKTMKAVSSELGDKVGEIQKQDKVFRDLQNSQVMLL